MPHASSGAASDAASRGSALRITRAVQPSAARGKTAECVAKESQAPSAAPANAGSLRVRRIAGRGDCGSDSRAGRDGTPAPTFLRCRRDWAPLLSFMERRAAHVSATSHLRQAEQAPTTVESVLPQLVPSGSDAGVEAGSCKDARATARCACKSPRIRLQASTSACHAIHAEEVPSAGTLSPASPPSRAVACIAEFSEVEPK